MVLPAKPEWIWSSTCFWYQDHELEDIIRLKIEVDNQENEIGAYPILSNLFWINKLDRFHMQAIFLMF